MIFTFPIMNFSETWHGDHFCLKMYYIKLKNPKEDPMKMWKSKWSQIFDTRCGKPYRYPKSPCQVSEKFIIGKVKISRHYTNQIAVGQALLWKGFVIVNKIQNFFTVTVKSQKILYCFLRFYSNCKKNSVFYWQSQKLSIKFYIFCNTVYRNCITEWKL